MRKIVFQVIQYKPFQILVESLARESSLASPSVFHFRIRTSFQVPGFEWVHELLLLCLTSNSAQFCAEIACGKTALGHNCTDSRFRMKNDFSGRRRGASSQPPRSTTLTLSLLRSRTQRLQCRLMRLKPFRMRSLHLSSNWTRGCRQPLPWKGPTRLA